MYTGDGRMHFQIVCYVPLSHVEQVKEAIFSTGAGRFGAYSKCCWQTLGEGQFFSHDDASPFTGHPGKLSKVQEVKIEVFCHRDFVQAAVDAMRQAHPYETPAYGVFSMQALEAE